MTKRHTILGVDWRDLGSNALGGLHVAGRVLATAFGGGALADTAENLESPVLPDWAKKGGQADVVHVPNGLVLQAKSGNTQALSSALSSTAGGAPSATVANPEYVVVLKQGKQHTEDPLPGAVMVQVVAGKRFDGNGYKAGEGPASKKFSFGYNSPSRVDIVMGDGTKASLTDVRVIAFLGGNETNTTRVAGMNLEDHMGNVIGADDLDDIAENDGWVEIVGEDANPHLRGMCVLGAAQVTARGQSSRAGLVHFGIGKSPLTQRGFTTVNVSTKPKKLGAHALHFTLPNDKDVDAAAMKVAARGEKQGKRLLKLVASLAKQSGQHVLGAHGHPRMSLGQMKAVAEDLIVHSQALRNQATKNAAHAAAEKKRVKAGVKAAAALLKPVRTGVHGEDDMPEFIELQEAYEVLGVVLGDDGSDAATTPLSTNPSITQAPDGADASGGGYPGPNDNNYGVGPAPTYEDARKMYFDPGAYMSEPGDKDQQYPLDGSMIGSVDDLLAQYIGAVPFTFQLGDLHQPPFKAITSFHTNNAQANPAAEGGADNDGVGAGFEWHGTEGSRWFVYWPENRTSTVNPPSDDEAKNLDVMQAASIKHGWGPLIGNPKGANTRGGGLPNDDWNGLRYAYGSGTAGTPMFFWFRGDASGNPVAPDWATAPEIAKLYNTILTQYQTQLSAAKQNYAAQVAQDAADAAAARALAKQNAKDDAATARQQQQEDQAAQHQADLAALQQQTDQGQLAIEQQKLDIAQQQAALQQAQQQAQQGGGYGGAGGGYVDDQGNNPFDDLADQQPASQDVPDENVDWGDQGGDQGGGDQGSSEEG